MSQTVSNTINVAVNLEGADDVVVKAQETAQALDAVAEAIVDGEKSDATDAKVETTSK